MKTCEIIMNFDNIRFFDLIFEKYVTALQFGRLSFVLYIVAIRKIYYKGVFCIQKILKNKEKTGIF